jgi:lipid-A-disaccharide synthase
MAVLPFEVDFFARHGVACTYVGHPAVEQGYGSGDGPAFRRRHAISADATVLAVLPGSRRGEVSRLLPVFRDALADIGRHTKELTAVIPTTEGTREMVAREVSTWPWRSVVVSDTTEQPDAFAACEAAITKSGTSTLHLALARVPMVVCYKVNALTAVVARRVIAVRHVALANLLTKNPVVPELLQGACTAQNISREIRDLLSDSRRRAEQMASFDEVSSAVGLTGELPSERAAAVVWDCMAGRPAASERRGSAADTARR